jgi:hypothetical protein
MNQAHLAADLKLLVDAHDQLVAEQGRGRNRLHALLRACAPGNRTSVTLPPPRRSPRTPAPRHSRHQAATPAATASPEPETASSTELCSPSHGPGPLALRRPRPRGTQT